MLSVYTETKKYLTTSIGAGNCGGAASGAVADRLRALAIGAVQH
jgi:hypothetical protein